MSTGCGVRGWGGVQVILGANEMVTKKSCALVSCAAGPYQQGWCDECKTKIHQRQLSLNCIIYTTNKS